MMFTLLKRFEKVVIQALMVTMAIALGLATIDMAWSVLKVIMEPPVGLVSVDRLLDLFGLFMLVLIGIELLETIMKSYMTQGEFHYEVVISVAIIAIARKVIILDVKEVDSMILIGIASIIVALTSGFYLMKRSQNHGPDRQPQS